MPSRQHKCLKMAFFQNVSKKLDQQGRTLRELRQTGRSSEAFISGICSPVTVCTNTGWWMSVLAISHCVVLKNTQASRWERTKEEFEEQSWNVSGITFLTFSQMLKTMVFLILATCSSFDAGSGQLAFS